MNLTLSELAGWCGGKIEPADAGDLVVKGVSTDSRTIREGELFVAIDGLNTDGHRFIRFAASSGAVAAVVEKKTHDAGRLPLVIVDDTLDALGRMANGYRWHPPLIPWIAITGSNGKTTTRELLSLILQSRGKVRTSRRNWNNFIGLPLSMMCEPDDAWVAVMELGTSHPGEIAKLREICVPTISVITSIGQSHLEGFGHTEAIAREKADVFGWLPPDGLAVFPADDENADILRSAVIHRAATFSSHPEVQADLVARDIKVTAAGTEFTVENTRVLLPLLGRHNIGNCLAAMAAARHLGIDLPEAARAVYKAKPVAGRHQATRTPAGLTVINDSYNANPNSMLAAIEVLDELPDGRKIVVFGDMLELGADSRRWHREIGQSIGMMDLDALFATGPESAAMAEAAQVNAHIVVRHFSSVEALWMSLRTFLKKGDQILVKGSRGMLMERIVNQLLDWFPTHQV
ncbi:MAG: UDP-N-acetylmuramoyl-tripeptide--D-alanyl-D-alanine ligase [Planctomycetes bacterium]|nr:UDP-N-acetylmuramoyl-tripeptide--D-alanyl-D-alanine ligase [Planctomycetota bacterium]